jgi:hypothetical protein
MAVQYEWGRHWIELLEESTHYHFGNLRNGLA